MQNFILALTPVTLTLEGATQSLGGTQGPDLTSYFQVCGMLLAVIGLVAFGMRKLISGSIKLRASQRSLHVIDVLNLGGRRKLAVVRCYDRTFVLGMGEKEIAAIAELDPVIGTDRKPTPPSKADDIAFAEALEKIQEALPEDELMTRLSEAQDRVSPSLAKKMLKPLAPRSVATPPAPVAPETIESTKSEPKPKTKVVKKRVRRKVAKRPAATPSHRQLEAEAVALAALDMAAAKRRASAQTGASGAQAATSTSPRSTPTETVKQASVEPPILRMEGILG